MNWARLALLVSMDSYNFLRTFNIVLYHKLGVKTGFFFVVHFFLFFNDEVISVMIRFIPFVLRQEFQGKKESYYGFFFISLFELMLEKSAVIKIR